MSHVRTVLIASAVACALVGAVAVLGPASVLAREGAVLARIGTGSPDGATRQPSAAAVIAALRDPSMSEATLADIGPAALLDALPELELGELRRLAVAGSETLAALIRRPPSVTTVTGWWARLSAHEQVTLELGLPLFVGNLEGVPFAWRDAANRRALSVRTAALERSIDSQPGRGAQQLLGRELRMLDRIRASLQPTASGPPRSLLALDTAYPGRAGIVLGDLETAAYVDIVVPGMYFSIDDRLVDWTATAERLHAEQTALLARLPAGDGASVSASASAAGAPAAADTVATVAWIGYRTPDLLGVGSLDLAREGADYLEDAIQGIRGLRRADPPYLAVLAHSYGSSAALLALSSGRASVDALAMVGSPGGAVRSAAELEVPAGRVFVGEAPWDPVPASAFFGTAPGSPAFGARLFGVSGARDPLTGEQLQPAFGHNGYFTAGTESLRNLALIGIDRADRITGVG